MDTPRITAYPIDRETTERVRLRRQAARARKRAVRPRSRWLGWLMG